MAAVDPEADVQEAACVGAARAVWRACGPGLSEVEYRDAVALELTASWGTFPGTAELPVPAVRSEVPCLVRYRGRAVGAGRRLDLVVGHRLVVEFKNQQALSPEHLAQLVVYLRQMGLRRGLLVNFPRLGGGGAARGGADLPTLVRSYPQRLRRACTARSEPEMVRVRLPETDQRSRLVAVATTTTTTTSAAAQPEVSAVAEENWVIVHV